jgi:predicted DNA-binding transcriptional regulator AlpA
VTALSERLALTVKEAASLTPFSEDTLDKAIRATDPTRFPPPLKAKRDSRGRRIILRRDLQAWLESLPDA